MTNEELAQEMAKGLLATGVEGGYDAVTCSTAGDYPSVGCSQWEGLDGGRGDTLLSMIPGGDQFIDRTYSDICGAGELGALAALLDSPEGQGAQVQRLAQDCLEMYVPALVDAGMTDAKCIIYAGIWCPTSHYVVNKFITRRAERGYDINDLEVLRDLFYEQYAIAADCADYADGYANRAETTYQYVSSLELE